MTIRFIIKKNKRNKKGECPVYLRLRAQGVSIDHSLGFRVRPEYWDGNKDHVKMNAPGARALNEIIHTTQNKIYELSAELQKHNLKPTPAIIKSKLSLIEKKVWSIEMVLLEYKEHLAAQGKLSSAGMVTPLLNHLQTYLKLKNERNALADITNLKTHHLIDFETYLTKGRGFAQSTAAKYFRKLRAAINLALLREYIEEDPIKSFKIKEGVFKEKSLTPDQLAKLESVDGLVSRDELVLDLFLFSCYTGISFCDIIELQPEDIHVVINSSSKNSHKEIRKQRKKTKVAFRVPLINKTLELIAKYQNHPQCQKEGTLLPAITNQECNRRLKNIALIAEIHDNLTFHMARHTCTSMLFHNGLQTKVVQSIIGHNEAKTTAGYHKVFDESYLDVYEILNKAQ